uniref:Uncharacterized protein n=1 Tax=Anopheles funestus TaxID=62324 RepID=A0A182RHS6_ANOFN
MPVYIQNGVPLRRKSNRPQSEQKRQKLKRNWCVKSTPNQWAALKEP